MSKGATALLIAATSMFTLTGHASSICVASFAPCDLGVGSAPAVPTGPVAPMDWPIVHSQQTYHSISIGSSSYGVSQINPYQDASGTYYYSIEFQLPDNSGAPQTGGTSATFTVPYFQDSAGYLSLSSGNADVGVNATDGGLGLGPSVESFTVSQSAGIPSAGGGSDVYAYLDLTSKYGPALAPSKFVGADGSIQYFSICLPLTPDAIAAGLTSAPIDSVPEPSSILLELCGFGLFLLRAPSKRLRSSMA